MVAPTTVLTASHCVAGAGSDLAVGVGTGINPHVGGEVIGVRHVVLAPDADPETFSHDVAVLQLDHAVPASVEPVAVATPADDATTLAGGARVEVAGVGQTDNVDPSSVGRERAAVGGHGGDALRPRARSRSRTGRGR